MLRRSAMNRWIGSLIITAALLGGANRSADAQDASAAARVVSSQIELARERARLQLELSNGRTLDFTLRDGQVWIDDRPLATARRGDALDRAWRDLLTRGMDIPADEFADLLLAWDPPAGEAGAALQRELVAALGTGAGASARAGGDDGASFDTVAALNRRIAELEKRLDQGRGETRTRVDRDRRGRVTIDVVPSAPGRLRIERDSWNSPLRHVGRGFAAILGDLVILAVLVGIGFTVVFFGRKQLEAVADTARNETLRSGLVGLAATFLVLPGYVLGIIALAISIVGIPLLLAWVPLFWVAVGVAALFGYLAVGHGIGEALAERRFYGGEWAKRANSYYYVLTGLVALMALFLAGHAVQMAGPWLGFIKGLLLFCGAAVTWIAFTIGFGAVLLTRAGTRPRNNMPASTADDLDMDDIFEEVPRA